MLTRNELKWIRETLNDYDPLEISPSYYYKKNLEIERENNKGNVRKSLDILREELPRYTPYDLGKLMGNETSKIQMIESPQGIYIIFNRDRGIYYVGQAKNMVKRAQQHFMLNAGNPEIYEHYCSGEKFIISLIPLEKTTFLSLNDLEDYAIRAYDSYPSGYNRVPGNTMVVPIFKNDDYKKVADIILSRMIANEELLSLTNDKKRMQFIFDLFSELNFPRNPGFRINFVKYIKEYQKEYKRTNKPL